MESISLLKLNIGFDTSRLLSDLEICLQQIWQDHYNAADYSGEWSAIGLRTPTGDEADINAHSMTGTFQDSPLLEQCLYFKKVLGSLQCKKGAVRLMKLRPGSEIRAHRDHDLSYASGQMRLHIPIQTNDDVEFVVGEISARMLPGECWYGNFEQLHSVQNKGSHDRVHLVVDCFRNDWTDELFKNSGADQARLMAKPEKDHNEAEKQLIITELKRMNTETSLKLAREMEAGGNSGT